MRIVQSYKTDVMELRGGGAALMLVGIPMVIGGGVLLAGAFIEGWDIPLPVCLIFGGILTVVGLVLSFARSGCMIDVKHGVVTKWWTFLSLGRRTGIPLADVTTVSITKEIRRSDKSTYTVYPVRLVGQDASTKIKLHEDQRYPKSRALAEQVAQFANLPLSDASTGTAVVRAPDELNESIRERLRKTGGADELPTPPDNLQSRLLKKGDSVMIELPVPPPNPLRHLIWIPVLIAIIIGVSIMATVLSDVGPGRKWVLPIAGVAGLIAIAVPIVLITVVQRRLRGATRILVSPQDGLRVEKGKRTTATIPAEELEELILPARSVSDEMATTNVPKALQGFVAAAMQAKTGITARSDKVTVTFGGQLPPAELAYIHAVIEYVLAS